MNGSAKERIRFELNSTVSQRQREDMFGETGKGNAMIGPEAYRYGREQ